MCDMRVFVLRIGVSVKQQFTEEEIYKDRDSQISAIEKTFEDAQKSVSGLQRAFPNYGCKLLLNSSNFRGKMGISCCSFLLVIALF